MKATRPPRCPWVSCCKPFGVSRGWNWLTARAVSHSQHEGNSACYQLRRCYTGVLHSAAPLSCNGKIGVSLFYQCHWRAVPLRMSMAWWFVPVRLSGPGRLPQLFLQFWFLSMSPAPAMSLTSTRYGGAMGARENLGLSSWR